MDQRKNQGLETAHGKFYRSCNQLKIKKILLVHKKNKEILKNT